MRVIRQVRARKTYDALIAAGFRLLQHREFQTITVAAFAASAGYSVGAFYSRFQSKGEFFDELLKCHLRDQRIARERLIRTLPDDELVYRLLENLAENQWKRRWFWRAVLISSIDKPKPVRDQSDEFAAALIAAIRERSKRVLRRGEIRHARQRAEVIVSVINHMIVCGIRPAFGRRGGALEELVRTFTPLSGHDGLLIDHQCQRAPNSEVCRAPTRASDSKFSLSRPSKELTFANRS